MNYCTICHMGVRFIARLNCYVHNWNGQSSCTWKGHTTATPRFR